MIVRLVILACLLVVPRWALALDIQSVKSDSGIEIWLVENHVNPIVSVAFGFKGGSGYDPPPHVWGKPRATSTGADKPARD